MESRKTWKYKGFTMKWNKENESYTLFNPDGEEEWQEENIEVCKEWIDDYKNDTTDNTEIMEELKRVEKSLYAEYSKLVKQSLKASTYDINQINTNRKYVYGKIAGIQLAKAIITSSNY